MAGLTNATGLSSGTGLAPTSGLNAFTGLTDGGVKAALDIDFVNNRAYNSGSTSIASLLSCTRASSGYYTNADGTLTQFSDGQLRYGTNGLLVEEQRTNYALRSQELDSAPWAALNATIAANAAVAPDGTTTAESLTGSGSLDAQRVGQYFGSITGQYTFSIYAKYGSHAYIQILHGGDGAHFANFDIQSGTVGTKGAGATSTITALTNGWYRCTITVTIAVAAWLYVHLAPSSSAAYGQASNTTGTVYLWGAQLEAGAFATSYIPTTSAIATRSADNVTFASASFIGAGSQTWYAEASTVDFSAYRSILNYGSSNLDFYLTTGTGTLSVDYATGLSTATSNAATINTTFKAAFAGATNDLAICLGGGTVATDALGNLAAAPSTIRVGSYGATSEFMDGYIKRLAYWPSRISNANLQTLTA